jgi:hypothetical protein
MISLFVVAMQLAIQCNGFIWIIFDFHLYLCGLHSSSQVLVSNHKFRKCILTSSSGGKVRKSLQFCHVLGYSYFETRYSYSETRYSYSETWYSSSVWRSNKIRNRFKTEYANAASLKTNLQKVEINDFVVTIQNVGQHATDTSCYRVRAFSRWLYCRIL